MTSKKPFIQKERCPWVKKGDTLYEEYHDTEWGIPCYDDRILFEFLVLESAQAGLSWITILRKRENYRIAFKEFDPKRIARFDNRDVERLLKDEGIVRNRLKIEATIVNARCFLEVQKEFGTFSNYAWSFVGGVPIRHGLESLKEYPTTVPESERLAADLKKRGFKFLGPTTVYAYMQAMGMVNDHSLGCFRYRTASGAKR